MGVLTASDLLGYFPGARLDENGILTEAGLETTVGIQESRVRKVAENRGYEIPDIAPDPKDVAWYIYELLSLEQPVSEFYILMAASLDPILQRAAEAFQRRARKFEDFYQRGDFDYAYLSTLPIDPLATVDDITSLLMGYGIGATGTPSEEFIETLINRFSAVVYCYLGLRGIDFESPIDPLLLEDCRRVVRNLAGAICMRARGETEIPPACLPQAATLEKIALETLEQIRRGDSE